MEGKMKAVVMNAPNDYGVQEIDIPKPGFKEVLVRIKAVAICGSDPKLFKGQYAGLWPAFLPFIAGHETAGEVVELGEGVTEFAIGDRVAGEAHKGCGTCANCLRGFYNLCLNYGNDAAGHRHYGFMYNGGYAEYCVYAVQALTKMPDNVSYSEAAMCDSAGTALNGVKMAGITPGGFSVIIGAGPVGIFAMQLAKIMGSTTIMIGRGVRLEKAKQLGADFTIDSSKEDIYARVKELTNGIGPDEVFECAGGEDTVKIPTKIVRKGGKVVFTGMPLVEEMSIPFKPIIMNQLSVYGSRANPNVTGAVLRLMANGRLNAKDMITHEFPMDQIHEAIDTFAQRKDGAMKVVVLP